jgi:hypothetical protein
VVLDRALEALPGLLAVEPDPARRMLVAAGRTR